MDKVPKLGERIVNHEERDAIHIAVAPVTADMNLKPGQFVCFSVKGRIDKVTACNPDVAIGIIDPFLRSSVKEGQHCWMLLKPGTITGLRHEWTHPAFDNMLGIAEFWMQEFADKHDMDYDTIMQTLHAGSLSFAFGNDINYPNDETVEQFMKYANVIAGKQLEDTPEFTTLGGPSFRCAC